MHSETKEIDYDYFVNFGLGKRETALPPKNEITSDFQDLKPVRIVDIKMKENEELFSGRNPQSNSNFQAPHKKLFKLKVMFSSLKKLSSDQLIYWIEDVELLGPKKIDLLAQYRVYISEVAFNRDMHDFWESRIRIFEEFLKETGIEIPGVEIKNQNSIAATNLTPNSSISTNNFRSSSVEADVFKPADIEGNSSDDLHNQVPAPSSRGEKPKAHKKALKNKAHQDKPILKILDANNSHLADRSIIFNDSQIKEKTPERKRVKGITRESSRRQKTIQDLCLTADLTERVKKVETTLDYALNIKLNEKILEIKKRYFSTELIDSSQAFAELESLYQVIQEILKDTDKHTEGLS